MIYRLFALGHIPNYSFNLNAKGTKSRP